MITDKKLLKENCINKGLDYNENKPWGSYYNLDESSDTKTIEAKGKTLTVPVQKEKLIFVNSGAELSIQKHEYRSEIWKALTNGVKLKLGSAPDNMQIVELAKDEEVNIAIAQWHQLFNDSEHEIIVHEIQQGACDEDDIERYNDKYGRK